MKRGRPCCHPVLHARLSAVAPAQAKVHRCISNSPLVQVCEFTGLPRHTAIELLLVHGGDPAAVLAQMFP